MVKYTEQDYSCESGLLIPMVVLLCVTVTSAPFFMASITVANAANPNISPTHAITEPSTTANGGIKNDTVINIILNNNVTQKAVLLILEYICFIDIFFSKNSGNNKKSGT